MWLAHHGKQQQHTKGSTDCGCHLLNVRPCNVGAVQAQPAPCLCHCQPILALNLHVIKQFNGQFSVPKTFAWAFMCT